jgi:hypothetical protein
MYDNGEACSRTFTELAPEECINESDWMFYDPNIQQVLAKTNAV